MSIKDFKRDLLSVELNDDELATIISCLFNSDELKLASKFIILKAKHELSYERGE